MARDTHQYARLSDGFCHYRIDGARDAPLVLLIHGATVPMWEFERIIPHLTAAGFATLCLDLFGHGFSARPDTAYTLELFRRQIVELLEVLELGMPQHLLGHSLGSAIIGDLIATDEIRPQTTVLAAPLVDFQANFPISKLLHLPMLGQALMPALVIPMLKRRRAEKYKAIEDGRFVGFFERQLEEPGFDRALLSLFQSGTLGCQRAVYAAASARLPDALIVRGALDHIVTERQVTDMRAILPEAEYTEIPGAGHPFLLTHPAEVAPALIEFMQNADRRTGNLAAPVTLGDNAASANHRNARHAGPPAQSR